MGRSEKRRKRSQTRHFILPGPGCTIDTRRVVALDVKHSTGVEKRYFCFGDVDGRILTVRFTMRAGKIRIIGAGYWREGKNRYEEENGL